MKKICIITALLVSFVFLQLSFATEITKAAAEEKKLPLQMLIDQARPGETMIIPAGEYEGPIVVDKPLDIQTDGFVQIKNSGEKPAIHIQSDGVRINGLRIIDDSLKKSAAILITADETVLEHLQIQTRSFGIQLRDANRNEIRNSKISWYSDRAGSPVKMWDKGNGIDLYNSHQNRMFQNEISNMHDGIYLENSNAMILDGNRVDHSRYGIHCMYTNGTTIKNNTGSFNVTGAMMMGVKDADVIGNRFYKQSENVNSQGLLLFDVQNSRIRHNTLEGNRVGLYVEQSHHNELIGNEIMRNFIGIQFLTSSQNRLTQNEFVANVIQAEATDSSDNDVIGNLWDAFKGIDLEQSGSSSIPYAINPFFQKMTASIPAFQLFFQSPGMVFLESMFHSNTASWTTDQAPLIKPLHTAKRDSGGAASSGTLAFSIILLLTAVITILYLGVRRS